MQHYIWHYFSQRTDSYGELLLTLTVVCLFTAIVVAVIGAIIYNTVCYNNYKWDKQARIVNGAISVLAVLSVLATTRLSVYPIVPSIVIATITGGCVDYMIRHRVLGDYFVNRIDEEIEAV